MPARPRHVAITKSKQKPKERPAPERWNGGVLGLRGIGRGISGMVFILNDESVVKVGFGSDESTRDIETERRAYSILQEAENQSPHVLRCIELDNPRGLVLELCHETVRQRLRSIPQEAFPSDRDARKWAKQASEGLAFIHDQDIIHADIGCHNMLLDADDTLKLCDFGGSSVRGSPASTKYELWSRLPPRGDNNNKPTRTSDIFALGSAIYEMSTKEEPYRGMPVAELTQRYQQGRFPPVKTVASLGDVIMNCWLLRYSSAAEIAREIDPLRLLCCGTQESPATRTLFATEGALMSSPIADTSTTALTFSRSAPGTARLLSRTSTSSSTSSSSTSSSSSSSSSTMSPSSKASNNPRRLGSLKELPSTGTTRHVYEYKQSIDHEIKQKTFFEPVISSNSNSKSNSNSNRNSSSNSYSGGGDHKKPTRRKTNNRSSLSKWMNKSLVVYSHDR